MSRILPSLGRFAAPVLSLAVLLGLLGASAGRAELLLEPAAPQAHASFLAMSAASPQHQRARLSTALQFGAEASEPGLTATFGWLEGSDEVLLMSHGPYPSAAPLARSEREVESAAPIRALGELPRYLMVCSWHAGATPTVAYAERDDANGREHSTRAYASLSVPWVPTAARRAQQPFAGRDWCGEIALGGRSSAPLWQAEERQAAR